MMKAGSLIALIMMAFFACNQQKDTMVLVSTSMGDIKLKLYDETPKHRDNFIANAKAGAYDGTLFHRVIGGFMIQGGDPQSKGAAAGQRLGMGSLPDQPLVDAEFNVEGGFIHKKGALAAARTGGPSNPEKKSSNCQFYIVQGKAVSDAELSSIEQRGGFKYSEEQKAAYKEVGGTPFLDGEYTVYGEVVEGLEVIDKIAAVQCDGNNRPKTDVSMTVKVLN